MAEEPGEARDRIPLIEDSMDQFLHRFSPESIFHHFTPPSRLDVPGFQLNAPVGVNVLRSNWRKRESYVGLELRYRYLLFDGAFHRGKVGDIVDEPFRTSDRVRGPLLGDSSAIGIALAKIGNVVVIPWFGRTGFDRTGMLFYNQEFGDWHWTIELRWSAFGIRWEPRSLEYLTPYSPIRLAPAGKYTVVGFLWHVPLIGWRTERVTPEPPTTTVLHSISIQLSRIVQNAPVTATAFL
ncbi:MAG: hypothetical protein AABY13_00140, partial [Nanoarchaeota archaeon]